MKLHIIAVVGSDGSIGKNGDLIRHLPEDLRHFKSLTLGSAVAMGRRTWDSLPRKPLPGRLNIIITRNPSFKAEGAVRAGSLQEAIEIAAAADNRNIFIIGGGEIYRQALPLADMLDLTLVDAGCPDADTFFPSFTDGWKEIESVPGNPSAHEPPYRFVTYIREDRETDACDIR